MKTREYSEVQVVLGVLEWLFLVCGIQQFIRRDNGPEFIAKVICQWLKDNGCQTIFINRGSPWKNGCFEGSFPLWLTLLLSQFTIVLICR